GALPRPLVHQPAGDGGDVRGWHGRRRDRRGGQHRSRDGWSGPVAMPLTDTTREELGQIIARYPRPRSALLPMLHLVQSEEGYVPAEGIALCAQMLELSRAEVAAVATFYSMYKRHPVGEYHVGVCTNTLCAVLGGDAIFSALKEHLGVGNDETTP